MKDRITILTPVGGAVATKVHRWDAAGELVTEPYPRAKYFTVRIGEVESLDDLERLLRGLEQRPHDFVVRGELIPGSSNGSGKVLRRVHGDGASLRHAAPGRSWVCLDIDDLEPDFYLSSPPTDEDLSRAAELARRSLPACFHRASCIVQWSASAGAKPWDKIRLHLWFWLARPVFDLSLRAWARSYPVVDAALFSPVQPHYTAAPVFEGREDPLAGRRIMRLPGVPVVQPPADWLDADSYAAAARKAEAPREATRPRYLAGETTQTARERWCRAALRDACEQIEAAGKGQRHDTIGRCAYAMGTLVAAGGIAEAEARAELVRAAHAVLPKSRHEDEERNIDEAMVAGRRTPRDLSMIGARESDAPSPPSSPEAAASDGAPSSGGASIVGIPDSEARCSGLDGDRLVKVTDWVADAPVDGHDVPHGYWLSNFAMGAWSLGKAGLKKPVICQAPIVVIRRCEDLDSGQQMLLLAWRRQGVWVRRLVPRAVAVQRARIIDLAEVGLPISSESAGPLAKYINDYEAANFGRIPVVCVSNSFGWQDAGRRGFLWGRMHFDRHGRFRRFDLEADVMESWPADEMESWPADETVVFRTVDQGDRQLAAALVSGGSFEAWRDALRSCASWPRALLGVAVALATPLLEITGCPNFCVDWGGVTSTGKSTALRLAASVWGNPSDKGTAPYLLNWDATDAWLERTLGVLRSLPLILDDTRTAKKPEQVSSAIYTVAQGQGRGRATLTGSQARKTWQTCMLSSGEQAATTFGASGGTKVRCLEVNQAPFGERSAVTQRLVDALKVDLLVHFGHAGPRFIAYLLQHSENWPQYRQRFAARAKALATAAATPAEARVADIRALLELTWELADEALGLGIEDPTGRIWDELTEEVGDAAGDIRALLAVAEWYHTRRSAFWTRDSEREPPTTGWFGAVTTLGGKWVLALALERLKRFLEEDVGLEPSSIFTAWRAKGWILCDDDERFTSKVNWEGRTRMVCIPLGHVDGHDEWRMCPGSKPAPNGHLSESAPVAPAPMRYTGAQQNLIENDKLG